MSLVYYYVHNGIKKGSINERKVQCMALRDLGPHCKIETAELWVFSYDPYAELMSSEWIEY